MDTGKLKSLNKIIRGPSGVLSLSSRICRIAFALDGKTIYGATVENHRFQVVSMDVSSGDLKAEKVISTRGIFCPSPGGFLVPVSEGVLLKEVTIRRVFSFGILTCHNNSEVGLV